MHFFLILIFHIIYTSNLLKLLSLLLISGINNVVSTAFGITETFSFRTFALNTVFSFPICDTHIQ